MAARLENCPPLSPDVASAMEREPDPRFGASQLVIASGPSQETCTAAVQELASVEQLAWEVQSTAAILELCTLLVMTGDVKEACRKLADTLHDALNCRRVAIALRGGPSGAKLTAISGMQNFDRRAELPLAMQRVLETAAESEAPLVLPRDDDPGETLMPAARRALEELVRLEQATNVLAAPLRTSRGESVGSWLFLGDGPSVANDTDRRFVAAAGEAVAGHLSALRISRPRLKRGLLEYAARRVKRTSAITLCAVLLCAAMWTPWDYKIACRCEIQPAVRRYVAAPFAGVFEKSLVEPGDLVRRDQVLGRLDGKEVRWELASVMAEYERVSKSYDVNLAAGKVAAAQIDRLEMERLDHKRRLLEHRAANLEIKSPIDGIVLSGDLKRSEGVPLTVGQRLYEIAPLEQMVVEVVIPDEEIALASPGQQVSIRLDAFAGQTWEGRLDRIHPRSEVRDDNNVFIGEVALANPEASLRPGMKGRAKVVTPPQPLGWILLHEPWNRIATWLGW